MTKNNAMSAKIIIHNNLIKAFGNGILTVSKKQSGVTLIALIMTVIILAILATVTIQITMNEGFFNATNEVKFKQELLAINEEYKLFVLEKKELDQDEFELETVYIGKTTIAYNTMPEGETGNIYTVMPSINETFKDKIEVIKGELVFSSTNRKELEWAQELKIKINPYLIVDGVLLSHNTNLMLVDENGKLTLPESVKEIGEGAFAKVEGLKEIIIPGTVKVIGKNAFNGCTSLEKVTMLEGVEKISDSAFQDCTNLQTVEMTDSVVELGIQVFYRDRKLINVKLSNKIKILNSHDFSVCTNLENLNLPSELEEIRGNCFTTCSKLKVIRIGKNVTKINATAFGNCPNLRIEVDPENNNFSSDNGILFNKDKTQMLYISSSAITGDTFIVPDTVTTLAGNLLNSYTKVKVLEIPASVTSFSYEFFTSNLIDIKIDENNPKYKVYNGGIYSKDETVLYYYFKNEATATFSDKLISLEHSSLSRGATNVENMILPESLEKIASQAIQTPKVTKISLGKNVNSIHALAFLASGITNIEISSENPNYVFENGSLYNKDKTILLIASPKRDSITKFTIPYGVEEIGNYAFHYQTKMTEVILSESLVKIQMAFNYCTSLKTIVIPKNVQEISKGCFTGSGINQITIQKKKDTITGAPWGATIGDRAIIWEQ